MEKEEQEEIQRRWSVCSHDPPCLAGTSEERGASIHDGRAALGAALAHRRTTDEQVVHGHLPVSLARHRQPGVLAQQAGSKMQGRALTFMCTSVIANNAVCTIWSSITSVTPSDGATLHHCQVAVCLDYRHPAPLLRGSAPQYSPCREVRGVDTAKHHLAAGAAARLVAVQPEREQVGRHQVEGSLRTRIGTEIGA